MEAVQRVVRAVPRLLPLASWIRLELASLDTVVVMRPTVLPEPSLKVVWVWFPEVRLSARPWSRPEASSKRTRLPVEEVVVTARPTVRPVESVTVLRAVEPLGEVRIVPSERPEASFIRIVVVVPDAVVVARPVVRPEASWRVDLDGAGGCRLMRTSERRGVGDCPAKGVAARRDSIRKGMGFMRVLPRGWTRMGTGYSWAAIRERHGQGFDGGAILPGHDPSGRA